MARQVRNKNLQIYLSRNSQTRAKQEKKNRYRYIYFRVTLHKQSGNGSQPSRHPTANPNFKLWIRCLCRHTHTHTLTHLALALRLELVKALLLLPSQVLGVRTIDRRRWDGNGFLKRFARDVAAVRPSFLPGCTQPVVGQHRNELPNLVRGALAAGTVSAQTRVSQQLFVRKRRTNPPTGTSTRTTTTNSKQSMRKLDPKSYNATKHTAVWGKKALQMRERGCCCVRTC